jgi:transposase
MKRSMVKRTRRKYTPEFKADTVRLVRDSGSEKTLTEHARDLGIPLSVLRAWVTQADIDTRDGAEGALTTTERAELARLRRENAQLREEREILKIAAAFFAKEST